MINEYFYRFNAFLVNEEIYYKDYGAFYKCVRMMLKFNERKKSSYHH